MLKWAKYLLLVVLSVFVLAEGYYRYKGQFKIYSESIGGSYISGYGKVAHTWYHTQNPNDSFTPPNSDFQYPYSTNALGLREKPLVKQKPDSTVRIVVFGDSFTEGFGAPYDSTWPKLLEVGLQTNGIKAEVINAGIAGSDIFFDYVKYRDLLAPYQADLVITSVNTSDINDYLWRGGMERFWPDSTTHCRKGPWYEWVYRFSHLARAIMERKNSYPYRGLFIAEKDYAQVYPQAGPVFKDAIRQFNSLAAQNGAGFVAVFHCVPTDILFRHYWINQASVAFLDSLQQQLQQQGINGFSLSRHIINKYSNAPEATFTYANDRHYRPSGYAFMAQLITDSLLARGLVRPLQQ